MKTRILLIAFISLAIGFVIGGRTVAFRRPFVQTPNNRDGKDFFDLLPAQEATKTWDWSEYRKGDWHIAIVWVQDTENHEARVYAFAKRATNGWTLVESEKLPYSQDRLDHILVNYPDRNVMLVNDQGILIHSLILGETELSASLDTGAFKNGTKTAVFRANGE